MKDTLYAIDNFNYKMNDEFMYALAISTNNPKDISILYYFMKTMGKNNISRGFDSSKVYKRAEVSKSNYYKLLKRLEEAELIIKLASDTLMVNPEMVINFRKSISEDRPQLLSLWSEYQKQRRMICLNRTQMI